jgi:DNA helicase-2/ATP-dependent DNA helicase PcrA
MSAKLEKLLARLNPEQRSAAEHREGPMLVAAVAGAGKTATIIARIVLLITNKVVEPSRVLAVTFSRKGADEMNERLKAQIGNSDARVGTFHSLALQIVKAEIPKYEDWKIDDRNRFKYAIKDAIGWKELDWKKADLTFLENYVSQCKLNLIRPWHDGATAMAKDLCAKSPGPHAIPSLMVAAYERAEELRIERQLLTFDDMLFEAVELLRDKDDVRQRWAAKWDYVIQDEAQDQNMGQLLMGELLAQDHRNYMLVGDPAQTIFTWLGARPEKLLGFEERWGAKVVQMGRNYRSGSVIIETANKVLGAMDPATRLPMDMICERGTEGSLRTVEYSDTDDEGEGIAAQILEMVEDGAEPRDFVCLYRTNAQSRGIEEALIGSRIPYRIIGGTNFYERKEVRDLLAYLRLADGRGDMEDVQRCINSPFRFLGKAFVGKVQDAYVPGETTVTEAVREACGAARVNYKQKESAASWADMIDRMHLRIEAAKDETAHSDTRDLGKPAKILEDVARLTQYAQWLIRDEGQETTENNKVSNVRELIRAAGRFPTVGELLDYIDRTISESKKRRKGKEPNKVTLTSLHRSKGMEWPVVFLAGVNQDVLPHRRAEDYEEERRLFYVGVTRARDTLRISCVRVMAMGTRVMAMSPSMFLDEAELTPENTAPEAVDALDD